MVVLYREQWGKTRWTAIEEAAVKEACFNGAWKRLSFVALDRTAKLPKWLPEYHVRYNWDDFGLDRRGPMICRASGAALSHREEMCPTDF
jgi:hypothetical protein